MAAIRLDSFEQQGNEVRFIVKRSKVGKILMPPPYLAIPESEIPAAVGCPICNGRTDGGKHVCPTCNGMGKVYMFPGDLR